VYISRRCQHLPFSLLWRRSEFSEGKAFRRDLDSEPPRRPSFYTQRKLFPRTNKCEKTRNEINRVYRQHGVELYVRVSVRIPSRRGSRCDLDLPMGHAKTSCQLATTFIPRRALPSSQTYKKALDNGRRCVQAFFHSRCHNIRCTLMKVRILPYKNICIIGFR
jgi:hypothetical protein